MVEYIPRESLLEILNVELERWIDSGRTYNEDKSGAVAMKEAIHEVSVLHAADVEEVKYGRWIEQTLSGEATWCCSECKTIGSPHWKRCPVCEAKMIGGQNEQKK